MVTRDKEEEGGVFNGCGVLLWEKENWSACGRMTWQLHNSVNVWGTTELWTQAKGAFFYMHYFSKF